jgi:hypothetical protein
MLPGNVTINKYVHVMRRTRIPSGKKRRFGKTWAMTLRLAVFDLCDEGNVC